MECTPLRVSHDVNGGLGGAVTCQGRFSDGNECTTLVEGFDSGGDCVCVGSGVYGSSSYFQFGFAVNLKLL